MSDIYTAQPWNCGDSDCLFGWHKESFWHYEDGTWTVDRYTDGNHQKCEPEDVPTWEQEEAAWVRYAEDVAETGEDPLSVFTVERTYKRTARWEFQYTPSILGMILVSARKGDRGPSVKTGHLPETVRDCSGAGEEAQGRYVFLGWEGPDGKINKSRDGLLLAIVHDDDARLTSEARGLRFTYPIERTVYRKETAITRDLKAAAKRYIKRRRKQRKLAADRKHQA